jgi:hypothetical protein
LNAEGCVVAGVSLVSGPLVPLQSAIFVKASGVESHLGLQVRFRHLKRQQ